MTKNLLFILLAVFNILIINDLKSQYYYNYEDFFSDSTFILTNNIKVVTITVPDLEGDSAATMPAYQRLCYNNFGKLAWYEFDSVANNAKRKYYTWHFYNDNGQRYKSRIFQRCEFMDSLREEVQYHYAPDGKLHQQDHYQIFIAAYREWSFAYEWQGDTLSFKTNDFGKIDTITYNALRKPTSYNREGWHYEVEYDDKGRKSKQSYFWINDEKTEDLKVGEMNFIYNNDEKLEKIETSSRIITFNYNRQGLPYSSITTDKFSGQRVGFPIFYTYEMKEDEGLTTK
jgi:hypothetical protein